MNNSTLRQKSTLIFARIGTNTLLVMAMLGLNLYIFANIGTGDKGYWNYEIDPTPTLEATPTNKANPTEKTKPRNTLAIPSRPSLPPPLPPEEELMLMHPAQIQFLVKKWRGRAIETLTPSDVKSYLTVQNVARKKASGYAAVVGVVNQRNPKLSLKAELPITNQGRTALYQKRKMSMNQYLFKSKDDFALLYFIDPSCQFCQVQDGVLKQYQYQYEWTIKPILTHNNSDLTTKFAIDITPSIVLISKHSEDWIPIATGVTSLPELKENIYRGARLLAGVINPTQFYTNQNEIGTSLDPSQILKE